MVVRRKRKENIYKNILSNIRDMFFNNHLFNSKFIDMVIGYGDYEY